MKFEKLEKIIKKAEDIAETTSNGYSKSVEKPKNILLSLSKETAVQVKKYGRRLRLYKKLDKVHKRRVVRESLTLLSCLAMLITMPLYSKCKLGYSVIVDDAVIGVVESPDAVEPEKYDTVVKVLQQPILYSNKEANITKEVDSLLKEQDEMAILEEISAEFERHEEEKELALANQDNIAPEDLIDYSALDTTNVGEAVVEIQETPRGTESIDLLAITEEDTEMITAYAVYIDDAYIGTVDSAKPVDETLFLLELPYLDTEGLIDLSFDKKVTYDKEIKMPKNMLTDPEIIADRLLSTEEVTRYYEVTPSDSIKSVCEKTGMTEEELNKAEATFNDEPVENVAKKLRVGTKIAYTDERKFIHVLVKKQTEYTDMIAFETETIEDDKLFKGTVKVDQEGVYGESKRVCIEVLDDGKIISSEEVSKTTVKEPIKEIIRMGTRETITEVNTNKNAGGDGAYFWPVGDNEGKITAYMGDGRKHKGLDIAAPYGTPIYASADGVISKTNTSGWGGGYGKYVLMDNSDGYVCMYAHMSYVAKGIEEGVEIKRGQLIGYVGSTGDSSGNHLHYEVRYNGAYLNPTNFISR